MSEAQAIVDDVRAGRARAGVSEMRAHTAAGSEARHSPFVPLLLMGLALLGWTAFQSAQLVRDRHALDGALAAQAPQITQAQRLRDSLSALASDTQKLADAGDAGAQLIVKQLGTRGITIHPGAASPTPP